MFHQTAPDAHARCAVRPRVRRITRLKHLALFALALGVPLTGARSAYAQAQTRLHVADHRNARVAVFDTKAIGPEQACEQAEATPAWVQTGAREYRHPSYWAGLVIVGDAR